MGLSGDNPLEVKGDLYVALRIIDKEKKISTRRQEGISQLKEV